MQGGMMQAFKYSIVALVAIGFVMAPAFAKENITSADKVKSRDIIWGAVGHSINHVKDRGYPYRVISRNQQLKFIREMAGTAYRTSCGAEDCEELISLTDRFHMVFLRSLELPPNEAYSEEANYTMALNYAYQEAKQYKGRIKYYEAGNELDNWTGIVKPYIGFGPLVHRQDRYPLARGYLRGLVDGVRAGDPDAKILINSTGWCHFGFMQSLWNDGLRWDITAVHWYEQFGDLESGCRGTNPIQMYASFGKPIWITEFNSTIGIKNDDQQHAAKWVKEFIRRLRELSSKYEIQAAFIYELLDEPEKKGLERKFGIIDVDENKKMVFDAMREGIIGQ